MDFAACVECGQYTADFDVDGRCPDCNLAYTEWVDSLEREELDRKNRQGEIMHHGT